MLAKSDKKLQKVLTKLQKNSHNKQCADCTSKEVPTFVNLTMCTFICETCSDIHKELNHSVKSLSDQVTAEELQALQRGGNEIARKKWLAQWKASEFPEPDGSDLKLLKKWIRAKYVERKWFSTSNAHSFERKHWNTPTFCQYCDGFIWGLGFQGFQCTICRYAVHKKCKNKVEQNCGVPLKLPTAEMLRKSQELMNEPIPPEEEEDAEDTEEQKQPSSPTKEELNAKQTKDDKQSKPEDEKQPEVTKTEKQPEDKQPDEKSKEDQQSKPKTEKASPAELKPQPNETTKESEETTTTKQTETVDATPAESTKQTEPTKESVEASPAESTAQTETKTNDSKESESQEAVSVGEWQCPQCCLINVGSTKCISCNSEKPRTKSTVNEGKEEEIEDDSDDQPEPKKFTLKQEIELIKKSIKLPGSIVLNVELDDCNNLCLKLSGPKKAAELTIMVPENYPKGDFMLFDASGDVKEYGRGNIRAITSKVIQEYAKQNKLNAVPQFNIPDTQEKPKQKKVEVSMKKSVNVRESVMTDITDEDAYPDDLDDDFSSDIATVGKQRILEYLKPVRDFHNDNSAGVYTDITGDCTLRVALPLGFLDSDIAHIWGINIRKPIIIEFSLTGPYYMDGTKVPGVSLFQSSDPELEGKVLDDVSSFALQWQIATRLTEWLKANWPPKDTQFLLRVMNVVQGRILNCTKNCIICDSVLPYPMLKPAVCDKNLCLFSHEEYGIGADVASEVRAAPEVVDLLISFTCAAALQGDIKRFTPFPQAVEVKVKDKDTLITHSYSFMTNNQPDLNKIKQVIAKMPPVSELARQPDTKSLKEYLDNIDPLCFALLRWIITSNRAHLGKLDKSEHITQMNTEHQYLFMSSPPEKERQFQDLKAKHGSFYAFHGSSFGNWHCILRMGLKNYSNTSMMTTGAAYGAGSNPTNMLYLTKPQGIYLAADSGTSLGYARQGAGWDKSIFSKSSANYMQCLCLCEVINAGYKANPYYVIPNEDHVMTRFFFIYAGHGSASVSASSLSIKGNYSLGRKYN